MVNGFLPLSCSCMILDRFVDVMIRVIIINKSDCRANIFPTCYPTSALNCWWTLLCSSISTSRCRLCGKWHICVEFASVGPRWQRARDQVEVRSKMDQAEKLEDFLRPCGRSCPGLPLTCCATLPHSRFDAQVFVLLLRRLWLPLPPTSRTCRCGRPLDVLGHHRASCAIVLVLGRRGFAFGKCSSQSVP